MKPVEVLLVEDNAGDTLLIQQTLAEGSIPVQTSRRHGTVNKRLQMLDNPDFSPGLDYPGP